MTTGRRLRLLALPTGAILLLLAGVPPRAASPETKADKKALLSVESIGVTPPSPGADTLCKLRVVLKNHGEQPASAFGFQVKINGQALPVYEKQRYLDPIEPGQTKEIALFNFWSSETDRPFPKDGSVSVEVALTEARWVAKRMEGDVPVWTMKDLIPGLPTALTVKKPFAAPSK
jgi:hypothetical protein